jgi:AcrR family transcriptional regulator
MAQSATKQLSEAAPARPATGAKLDHIIACATKVFCDKGYEGASIRDISRLSGVSLAGLYYYFESKEELLYLIQKHCFTTLIEQGKDKLKQLASSQPGPEARLRTFIHNHVGYFLQNPEAMKVLSHESDTLTGPYAEEVAEIKRAYYHLCRGLLEDLKKQCKVKGLDTRVAVMSLFGMMNWVYTWHNPEVDPKAEKLAEHMTGFFLKGVLGAATQKAG